MKTKVFSLPAKTLLLVLLLLQPCLVNARTENEKIYGDTPGEYVPYGNFTKPYKEFFLTPNEYHGYGRQIAEPEDVKEIKIGFLGPIEKTVSVATGGVSHEEELGLHMLRGAKLAISHANETGGYKGTNIPYTLVIKNDNGLWGASANEIVSLAYKEKVWAILGTIDGANSHIAIRTALKAEVSIVNSGDTDPTFTETAIPWAFRNITDDRQMCYLLADYIFKELKLTRIAALRANNRYGRIGIDEFRDAATRSGHPFIIEMNYLPGDKDFTPQLDIIEKMKPEAILTYGDAEESAMLLKQMRQRGMNIWFIGSDRIVSKTFTDMAGDDLSRVIAPYPYDSESGSLKQHFFKKAYVERYGEEPETFASHAYDGVFMIIEAMEKAGLNRAKIRDELAAMKTYDGVSGTKHFDPIFNNLSSPVLALGSRNGFVFHAFDKGTP